MEEGYCFRSSFVLGFHGCDDSTAHTILTGRTAHLRPSENRFDWLGTGIYFWEASPMRALQYARASVHRPSPRQGRIRTPTVIGAIIDLGYCLDLLDSQYFGIVRRAHRLLVRTMAVSGEPMPTNRPLGSSPDPLLRDLDCSVINAIHDQRQKEKLRSFDSVRAAFMEGTPLYKGANFYDKNHVQVCVRNVRCIKGYFRPIL